MTIWRRTFTCCSHISISCVMSWKEQLVCKLKKSLWLKTCSEAILSEVWQIHGEQWFHKSGGWLLLLFQVVREFLYHATVVHRWYTCCWVQHEGDCESQGQFGEKNLNEGLGSYEKNSWNENQQREKRGCWKYHRLSVWRRCWRSLTWQMLNLLTFHSEVTSSSKGIDSDDRRWKGFHVIGVICISYEQPDVCYGLHEIRHRSSNESCQQIHEQSREEALESCELDSEISEGQFRYNIVLWRHRRSPVWIYWL